MPDLGKSKETKSNDTRRSDSGSFTFLPGIQMPEVLLGYSLESSSDVALQVSLRPLLRLRQLAGEIQSAFRRGDMDVVGRASNLLAPTLAQWAASRSTLKIGHDAENAATNQIIAETQRALAECESLMQDAMAQNRVQSSHIRQYQQRVRRVRAQRVPPRTGRVLDARH